MEGVGDSASIDPTSNIDRVANREENLTEMYRDVIGTTK
jgi:hypothetical protein